MSLSFSKYIFVVPAYIQQHFSSSGMCEAVVCDVIMREAVVCGAIVCGAVVCDDVVCGEVMCGYHRQKTTSRHSGCLKLGCLGM